jgi:RNase P subunit RPR2
MVKEQGQSLSSFICYNCNEKNYFDKMNYLDRNAGEISQEIRAGGTRVKEVSIECKSCREINNVAIEY